eukprot:jgi/Mesen1/1298/ME000013S00792
MPLYCNVWLELLRVGGGWRARAHQVMRWTKTRCDELDAVTISDLVLSSDDAEDILGWATGHYMRHASCPEERDGQLIISLERCVFALSPSPPLPLSTLSCCPLRSLSLSSPSSLALPCPPHSTGRCSSP